MNNERILIWHNKHVKVQASKVLIYKKLNFVLSKHVKNFEKNKFRLCNVFEIEILK